MRIGWIRLYRSLLDNWLWTKKPFSYGQAWVDLLLLANSEDHQQFFNGGVVDFKAGTVHMSILSLSDRWGWSRKKTTRFLEVLERDEMATTNRTTHGTTITIEKWDLYQDRGTTNGTTMEQQMHNKCTSNAHNKRIKELKNERNIYIRSSLNADFEKIWELYPRKQGKAKAYDYFVKAVDAGEDVERIRDGVERYAAYVEADDIEQRFVKMGSTFFSQKSWLDEWTPKNRKKELDPEVKMLFTDLFADGGEVV